VSDKCLNRARLRHARSTVSWKPGVSMMVRLLVYAYSARITIGLADTVPAGHTSHGHLDAHTRRDGAAEHRGVRCWARASGLAEMRLRARA